MGPGLPSGFFERKRSPGWRNLEDLLYIQGNVLINSVGQCALVKRNDVVPALGHWASYLTSRDLSSQPDWSWGSSPRFLWFPLSPKMLSYFQKTIWAGPPFHPQDISTWSLLSLCRKNICTDSMLETTDSFNICISQYLLKVKRHLGPRPDIIMINQFKYLLTTHAFLLYVWIYWFPLSRGKLVLFPKQVAPDALPRPFLGSFNAILPYC